MIIPLNVSVFVALHEGSHLVFDLTWSLGPVLADEYVDGIQDDACVMESDRMPLRWCSDANHVTQSAQPHSCWRQILTDYPAFGHAGADTATDLPSVPRVTYDDTP